MEMMEMTALQITICDENGNDGNDSVTNYDL
jgi:hypothetical protein